MARKQDEPLLGTEAPARPGDPIELDTSVAGEEDPGASFDVPETPAVPAGGNPGAGKVSGGKGGA